MTHVFIIPEPHIWDKSFKNRDNYPKEISTYLERIVTEISNYAGDKYVIFPGDVFHRGFTSFSGLVKTLNFFALLNKITLGRTYSCVGNHELSYANSNPFWILAEDSTERYTALQNVEAYSSIKPGIKIVDNLDIGNLRFVMGHYARADYEDNSDKDIVLISHNSILEKDITAHIQTELNRECNVDYMQTTSLLSSRAIPISSRLKYVFVGHMHTFYSSFSVEEAVAGTPLNFQLQYLGSLGRTSISEIDDNDLVRTIPHFSIDTDGSYKYEPFVIELQPRTAIVYEDVVVHNQEKYSQQKTVNRLKESNVFGDTAESAIVRSLEEYPEHFKIFSELYYNSPDPEILKLIQEGKAL